MSESNASTELDGESQAAGNSPQPPATPRWVKITGAVLAVLVIAIIAKLAFGGGIGGHGPSMHGGGGSHSSMSEGASTAGASVLPEL